MSKRDRDTKGRFLPVSKTNTYLRNSLYGCAFGDALGYPIEFSSDPKRLRGGFEFVRNELTCGALKHPKHGVSVSDDTQMSLYLASALSQVWPVNDGHDTARVLLTAHIVEAFKVWHKDPENNRAPGGTCMSALGKIQTGVPWMLATLRNSKGNGANMRCGWLGTLDLPIDAICGIAQVQAAITHGHPTALAAAELTAVAAWYLRRGAGVYRTLEYLYQHTRVQRTVYREEWLGNMWRDGRARNPQEWIARGWDEMEQTIFSVLRVADRSYPTEVTKIFRNTGAADDALGAALLALYTQTRNPVDTLRYATCHNGDSDSVGAIAGTLLGASGCEFDPAWYRNVEYVYGGMIETVVGRLS